MRGLLFIVAIIPFICRFTSFPLASSHISSSWKFIPTETDVEYEKDVKLHKYLAESIPEALPHTGATSFDDHLKGVQAVLRKWGSSEYICDAGLFHSIYGTEGFQGYKLSVTRRPAIRNLIGFKSERLVWIFCMVDRLSVDSTVFNYSVNMCKNNATISNEKVISTSESFKFHARDELGRFPIEVNKDEWLDFLELTLADWLEQVEGAAEKENKLYGWKVGEAWSYRRNAYKQMADILAHDRQKKKCVEMYNQVYAQEAQHTRNMIQTRTPPMTQAAKEAREAIESVAL